MTIDSTKYFCNRGALSARFILVDTPLRGEYYYDGEHGKYYFGARYFDPFFGMWMSPDPAGQFSNPYTYGGDPLNYVDPNGEWAHVVVGAIIGGAIGVYSGYRQCNGSNDADCGKKMLFNGLMGAGVGAATAATGGAISGFGGTATGAVGLKFGGTAAAITGAGIEGAMIGAAGGAVSYAGTGLVSMANTGSFDWNPRDLVSSMGYGAASGFVTGALTGAISYNISDEYAWSIDKQVLEYGNESQNGILNKEIREKMAKYVLNAENLDYSVLWDAEGKGTASSFLNGKGLVVIDEYTGTDAKGKFSASRFYSSIVHENGHIQDKLGRFSELYSEASNLAYKFKSADYQTHYNSIREIGAIRYELNHRYFQFWSPETQQYARDRLMRSYFGLQLGY